MPGRCAADRVSPHTNVARNEPSHLPASVPGNPPEARSPISSERAFCYYARTHERPGT